MIKQANVSFALTCKWNETATTFRLKFWETRVKSCINQLFTVKANC